MIDNEKALALYRAGATDYEIGKALDKDANLIYAWRKRRGLPANVPPGGRSKLRKAGKNKCAASKRERDWTWCRGCAYWADMVRNYDGIAGYCQYILLCRRRRPCPSGPGCTVRKEADRTAP